MSDFGALKCFGSFIKMLEETLDCITNMTYVYTCILAINYSSSYSIIGH